MENGKDREYAIEVLDANDEWVYAYVADSRDEVERVWRRMREAGLKRPARLVEVETLQISEAPPSKP